MSDPFAALGAQPDTPQAADPFAALGAVDEPSPPPSPSPSQRGSAADFADAFSDTLTMGLGDKVAEEIEAVRAGNQNPAQASELSDFQRIQFAESDREDQLQMLRRKSTENTRKRMQQQTARLNASRDDRSPYASGAGKAAGIIAPMVASAGLGAAGGASAGAATAARAGASTEQIAHRLAGAMTRQPGLAERAGALAGRTAEKIKFDKTLLADAIGGGGAITGAKAALMAASKAPAGAAALKAALRSLAARAGPKASLASVVESGTIGLERALQDEEFAEALQLEYEASR